MKKIISLIIVLTIFFSSLTKTFAEEWYIEKLLNLNYWVEEFNLNLSKLNNIYFNDEKNNRIFNELKTVDSLLTNQFMLKYKNWEYEYYEINWIIKNYNNFIYYTNKYFYFIKLNEQRPYYKENNTAILNSYKNMISSYKKIKYILTK